MEKHLKLFKKDMLLQRKSFFITIIVVLGMMFINKTPDIEGMSININFITSIFLMVSMVVTTTMVNDDKSSILMIMQSLPFKRKDFVLNKYLFVSFLTLIISTVLFSFLTIVSPLAEGSKLITTVFVSDFLFTFGIIQLYYIPIFPLFFKYGYAKTQIFNMMIIVLLMGATATLSYIMPESTKSMDSVSKASNNLEMILPATMFLLFSTGFYYLSYKVSSKFYEKREL